LTVVTNRIGSRLETELGDAEVPVVVGMRYGRPSIGAGLERLVASGCRRVVVLPLFPQYSRTTTASVMDAVGRATSGWNDAPTIRSVTEYHDHPAYLDALVTTIREAWADSGTPRRLLVSFHGLPQRYADAGDPYPIQCARTAKALAARLELAPGTWHMAYQSRFGRERWLRPVLDDRLDRWGRLGLRGVDVICPGFATDCLETLEEVAMAGRRRFESAGGSDFRYLPALNDHPKHITALSQIVMATAADWLDQKTSSR
jgi:ferrochelatase